MEIAANTKIAAILKANPNALEAIANINHHFGKLRNPLLRKILASRVTIADAARIGGCTEEEFYRRLEPLGFKLKKDAQPGANSVRGTGKPAYLKQLSDADIFTLDVREDISTGNDPFLIIMDAVEKLKEGNALLLINTFEPTPLIDVLKKKGYAHYAEVVSDDLVHTYFWLQDVPKPKGSEIEAEKTDFDVKVNDYEGRLRYLDVRHLEMPQPMITILNELEMLPEDEALYVTHRKVPQFLLPKLHEREFEAAIKEAGSSEVLLLIYKKKSHEYCHRF